MDKSKLKDVAYKQQIDHLAQAQTQAMKILIDQQQPFKLTVDSALQYLESVKSRLGTQFPEFMQIMRECREPNSDCMVTITKVCQLFQNYPELLQGFGMFLPPSINLQVQTAGRFIVKADSNGTLPTTVKPEMSFESDSNESLLKSTTLIAESDSTMDDIQDIESEKSCALSQDIDPKDYAVLYITKVKDRFHDQPGIFEKFLELLDSVRKDCMSEQTDIETDVFMEISDLFQNNMDLIEEFKTFVPNASFPQQLENADDFKDGIDLNFLNEESMLLPVEPLKETLKCSLVNDPSIAAVGKYGSFDEHLFFDKVRKALYHKEVYDNFLRCLMLFVEDVVTRSELLKVATSFLGKFPDLLKQFKDLLGFNESGHNIETIPIRIVNYENYRSDPEVALDIDYSTGGRNGASYRALPRDLKQPKCSGRTPLCKEVLNDTWVSFPSWSEDSTFVTSCKTEFEEMIYRCEDERFELDMAIEANAYTIQALENVQKKINKMTPEEKGMFSLDDTLGGTSTVLHQKALHRCYGDKTDELVEGLKRNPVVAVPIILKRLRGKEEEWKEKQKQFNHIWRGQIDSYYLRSLDHMGINFKQNDSKSFRSKSLLNEMEMVHAEKKANSVIHFSSPHFSLEFKEKCVFLDASNLICQYLKKLPGIFRDDRRRIELIVKKFVPDFFGFPRTMIDEETADEEEEETQAPEVMDIDNEEISGHTSPAGSANMSKDEEFSDQEESNSVEENESEDSDKNSFIEDSDIFDKLDTLYPTNLPYILFFVNKNWYVFFCQFHILCERLARLLHESNRKDIPTATIKNEEGEKSDNSDSKPSYIEFISKLSQLLSGAIDYAQFEDEARSLFGIHAFVSFTMDRLILNIVRQLQQIVGDDICKQCTSFFYLQNKIVVSGSFSSPFECQGVENQYLKKVERIMNEEKCFKVLWHKKDQTLTIEMIEHVVEKIDDPYEVEKWSYYLDSFVTEDSVSEEILAEATGLPVILPRNLRRQKEYWKRKVAYVENLWKKRHSPSFIKKNPPKLFCKRKADYQSYLIPSKLSFSPANRFDESISMSSAVSCSTDSVADSTQPELVLTQESYLDLKVAEEPNQLDDNVEKQSEEIVMQDNVQEVVVSEQSEVEIKTTETVTVEGNISGVVASSATDDKSVSGDALVCVEKSESTHVVNDTSVCEVKNIEEYIDSVAAFHDIAEESMDDEVVIEEKAADPVEVIVVEDSPDEADAVSDSDSANKKDKPASAGTKSHSLRPKKDKQVPKSEYSIRPRRNKPQQDYVKRRTKKGGARTKKVKNTPKQEEIDFLTLDFEYFSELPLEDKCSYLSMNDLVVQDDTEGHFKRENYKLLFIQNCDTYLYRKNCLSKAKEIHQQVCEIKTSNFNAWHRVWLDRYVTTSMSKFCSDWLLKSDPEKFKLVCITVSDCSKPPYIPYSKYRVRYYKTDV